MSEIRRFLRLATVQRLITKKLSKKVSRFPRMEGITAAVKLTERVLWKTYNKLSEERSHGRRYRNYDFYKSKVARRAPFFFLLLAQRLVKKRIDPALYLKVMGNWGEFSKYMPSPSWLAKRETIRKFSWKLNKERNKFEKDADWRKAKKGFVEKDVFKAIKNSGSFLMQARKNFQLKEVEAMIALIEELSPWFISAYLASANDRAQGILTNLLKTKPAVREQVMVCLKHLSNNRPTWKRAHSVLLKVLD